MLSLHIQHTHTHTHTHIKTGMKQHSFLNNHTATPDLLSTSRDAFVTPKRPSSLLKSPPQLSLDTEVNDEDDFDLEKDLHAGDKYLSPNENYVRSPKRKHAKTQGEKTKEAPNFKQPIVTRQASRDLSLFKKKRFFGTFHYVYPLTYGNRKKAIRAAKTLTRLHERVEGRFPETVGELLLFEYGCGVCARC